MVKGRVKVLKGFGLLSNGIRQEYNGPSLWEQEGGSSAEEGPLSG